MQSPRLVVGTAALAFAVVLLGIACGSSSSTAGSADGGPDADEDVDACQSPGCAAVDSMTSSCGWQKTSTTCSGGLTCDATRCFLGFGGKGAETCSVTLTANDGVEVELALGIVPGGCGFCGGVTFTGPDGSQPELHHVCTDGGADAGDAGDATSADAGDAAGD